MVVDAKGNVHIVWASQYGKYLIYKVLDKSGNVLVEETSLTPADVTCNNPVRRPSIAMDSKGMLHIVFHAFSISNGFITDKYTNCENFGGSSEVIYIKVNPAVALNKTGTINDLLVVKEKVISTQDNIKSRAANIAYDDKNDRLHVVWFDGNNISDLDLNYLVLDTNGNPIGGFADPLPMFASVYS